MTQANPILGAGLGGLAYRTGDNNGKQALLNHHKGSSAPSYAEAGAVWLDDAATPWLLKIHDGTDWIVLFAVNASSNTALPFVGGAGLKMISHAADTGTANAYAVAPSPAIADYASGMAVWLKAGNANTGASTIAVSGLAAKSIKMQDGGALTAGAMLAGGVYLLFFDGANFILLNPAVLSQRQVLWVTDQQAGGTAPNGAMSSAWTKKTLNTVPKNTVSGASHSSGTITLPAGTYTARGTIVVSNGSAVASTSLVCRLRDTTNGVTLVQGMPQGLYYSPSSAVSQCEGTFTLAGTAAVELQYYASSTAANLGCNVGSGDDQVWAGVHLVRES